MSRNVSRGSIILVALVVAFLTLPLVAQTNFGRISGTVLDASGAVVPGAKITIKDTETQAARAVLTDDKGFYVVENLPVGPYVVQADHPGFKRATVSGLALVADGRLTANFKLQLGDATQVVEVVAANTESLNTVSGEVAHVVDQQQIENLALNGGGYTELLTLVPGATVTNPDQFGTLTSLSATNQAMNGHRTNENNLTVDGVGNLDAGSNGSLINNVSPDLIQEVKIQTSNFSAEYGRSTGAAFNVVTKDGSNQIHGAAFEYLRNDVLDARNFFAPNKTELRYNYFGYDLGGPIKKDKIFFFVAENWRYIRQQSAPVRESLPSTSELQGVFPSTTSSTSRHVSQPEDAFPQQHRPRLDDWAERQGHRQRVSVRHQPGRSLYQYRRIQRRHLRGPNPLNYRQDMGRLDYRINDNHTLFGRWIDDYNSIYLPFGPSSAGLPSRRSPNPRSSRQELPAFRDLGHLSFHGQRSSRRRKLEFAALLEPGRHLAAQYPRLHLPAGVQLLRPLRQRHPRRDVNNLSRSWEGPELTLISPTTQIELGDTLSIVRGQHSIRTGVLIIRNRKDQNGRSAYDGNVVFNPAGNPNTTNYALADALLGNFSTYTEAAYDPMGHYRYTEPAAFIDDTWKVSRKLSLNLGLRYEYMMAMYSTVNNLSAFRPVPLQSGASRKVTSSGNLVPGVGNIYNGLARGERHDPGQAYLVPNANDPALLSVPSGAPRGIYPSQNAWQPRVGFAYSLTIKPCCAAVSACIYDRLQGNPTFYSLNNPPFVPA